MMQHRTTKSELELFDFVERACVGCFRSSHGCRLDKDYDEIVAKPVDIIQASFEPYKYLLLSEVDVCFDFRQELQCKFSHLFSLFPCYYWNLEV